MVVKNTVSIYTCLNLFTNTSSIYSSCQDDAVIPMVMWELSSRIRPPSHAQTSQVSHLGRESHVSRLNLTISRPAVQKLTPQLCSVTQYSVLLAPTKIRGWGWTHLEHVLHALYIELHIPWSLLITIINRLNDCIMISYLNLLISLLKCKSLTPDKNFAWELCTLSL